MITVIGHGSASQIPDILTLSIGIEARRASVAEAYGAAGAAMQSVLDRLRDLDVGPQDTTTSSLNIRAESGWQEGLGNVVTGYLVSSSMTVRLSFQVRAREIIAAAVEAGGDDVRLNGLQPSMSDPGPVLEQARANAWKDARTKAEHYAALAGHSLGPVHSVREGDASDLEPGPMPAMMRVSSGSPLPLEAGESTVDAAVTIIWELV
ncbi:MAG TPA: SIMPL domain-containing protein [Micrococcaceae bacterium]|jgi:hypothetical protein|nr:SIMPL domain-containing protein [Micrococcaceae bacterium]